VSAEWLGVAVFPARRFAPAEVRIAHMHFGFAF
jgi:hypothetical protein